MQNLLSEVAGVLEKDDRLFADGALLKNKVVELALKLDPDLIRLLLPSPAIRRHFFVEVDGVHVFDKVRFQRFVTNKRFLPDSYTAFKNKIGLTTDEQYITDSKEVVLSWPYKDCVLEGGQRTDRDKRTEVFWNETLAPDDIDRLLTPKVLTNFKRYSAGGLAPVGTVAASENWLIKGNNLLVLHSLQRRYLEKVKLIYIDPPYNTGGDDFTYNDAFTHSAWLTFMRNRLEAAKALLRKDGVIAISIDHNEGFYLKVLCDELFGRANFIACITVQNNPKGRVLDKHFSTSHEYLLLYSKNKLPSELSVQKTEEELKRDYTEKDEGGWFRALELRNTHREFNRETRENLYFPLYVNEADSSVSVERSEAHSIKVLPHWNDGFEGCWTWSKTKCEIEAELLEGRKTRNKWRIIRKSYSTDAEGETVSRKLKTIWFRKDFHTEKGQKALDELVGKGRFKAPKPVGFIKTIIDLVTESHDEDIVLDFFCGSGTTAHAVEELNGEDGGNRSFILSEQLDYVDTLTLDRLKAVQRSYESRPFVSCELARANACFVERIEEARTTAEIDRIWQEMQTKGFMSYRLGSESIESVGSGLADLPFGDKQRLLVEVLDKNMLYVPLTEIEDQTYGIDGETHQLNALFYGLPR